MPEEKIFTIPLRDAFDTERTHRAKKAVDIVRHFLTRHMKSEDVKIGNSINKDIWARGIQRPPRRIRIHAVKENEIIYAELLGVDIKTPTKEEVEKKAEKKKQKEEKIKEERKERKKMTIKEELEEESGKTPAPVEEMKVEKSEEKKEA